MSKVIDRIEKLIRLASPNSGSTEHERASAALEVIKLIEDNNLIVRERKAEPAPKRSRRTEPAASTRSWSGAVEREPPVERAYTPAGPRPPGDWIQSRAMKDTLCSDEDCATVISAGEQVWMRMRGFAVEYLHCNGPCGW